MLHISGQCGDCICETVLYIIVRVVMIIRLFIRTIFIRWFVVRFSWNVISITVDIITQVISIAMIVENNEVWNILPNQSKQIPSQNN